MNSTSDTIVSHQEVEAACKAMWMSWGRMRPDHERKHREDMRRALMAAAVVRIYRTGPLK